MSQISETVVAPGIVRRSDRGLCVAGRRITLYLIEDYLRAGWRPHTLQNTLQLTEQEISQAIDYLNTHRAEFVREYEQVADQAAEREKYWRRHDLNRRKTQVSENRNVTPERAAAWARLNEIKRQEKRA